MSDEIQWGSMLQGRDAGPNPMLLLAEAPPDISNLHFQHNQTCNQTWLMTLDSFGFSKKHVAWFSHWTCTEGHRALTPFECYHDATFSQDFLCLKTLAEVVKVGSPILKPCGGVASERWFYTHLRHVSRVSRVSMSCRCHTAPRGCTSSFEAWVCLTYEDWKIVGVFH